MLQDERRSRAKHGRLWQQCFLLTAFRGYLRLTKAKAKAINKNPSNSHKTD